ncbi:MAG: hypothetical protein JWL88_228 [Parcubacteria group bacterium]|nr:hypothetical protein [Parcubacteria group bacterium]
MKGLSSGPSGYSTDPISKWPPVPENPAGKRVCKAIRGNLIAYQDCTDINTNRQGVTLCAGCPCEWRVCRACSPQRVTAPDIRKIDITTGLCDFHSANGASTLRPAIANTEEGAIWIRPNISIFAQNAAAGVIASKPKTEATEEPIPDPVEDSIADLDPELIATVAKYAHGRLSAHRIRIMRELGNGKKRREVATSAGTSLSAVNATLIDIGKALHIPTAHMIGSKTEYLGKVLGAAYREMKKQD